ncbi:MAG: low molecular weight phosphatase family protein [Nitriliruptorales bacterium]
MNVRGGDRLDILVVCMGNICRSPFAEVLLTDAARRYGPGTPVRVRSAGIRGLGGHAAMPEMQAEATSRGLDLSRHVARGIDPARLVEPDLVLAMTAAQRDHLTQVAPAAASRTFTLRELAALAEEIDPPEEAGTPGEHLREVAARADRARRDRPGTRRDRDVDDPYGAGRAVYARIAQEIEDAVRRLAPVLFGGHGPSSG